MDIAYTPQHVIETVKDYEGAGIAPSFELTIDRVPMTHLLMGCEWGWQDGAAQLLKAKLASRLPDGFQGKQVEMIVDIGGYRSQEFRSAISNFGHDNKAWTSSLIAATAGALADKWRLLADLEVDGWLPEDILLNGAMRLPYDPSQIQIAKLEEPLIQRTDATATDAKQSAFREDEYVQGLWDSVITEAKPNYFDTARGVRFENAPGIGLGAPVIWSYTRGSKEIISWDQPERVDPDEEFSAVIVLDKNESGTNRIRSVHSVDHFGQEVVPGEGQVLYIPFSDTSAGSEDRAATLGAREAQKASYGRWKGSSEVVYNPFIRPGRVVQFIEDYKDDAGLWRKEWLVVVDKGIKFKDVGGLLSTEFGWTATRLKLERLPDPAILLPGVHPPFVSQISAPPIGRDADGLWLWVPGSETDTSGFWMGRDEDGFWVTKENSGDQAGRDPDFYFNR